VFVRDCHKRKGVRGTDYKKIVLGTIEKVNTKLMRYRVKGKWYSIEDIACATDEMRRKKISENQAKMKRDKARDKYYLIKSMEDRYLSFIEQGFEIGYDPPGTGSCQFEALAHQLVNLGHRISHTQLRREVVMSLQRNPYQHGIHLHNFVGKFTRYLLDMSHSGTYGDNITVQRIAELYNTNIVIVSSHEPDHSVVISPSGSFDDTLATLTLGHLPEGHGEHYLSLMGSPFH